MKLLTVTVPCFNSAAYMENCIESLLTGGDAIEIIIVNDGSKDNTRAIADAYQARYPGIVRVEHKENGGHGSGVNRGIALATGRYFKVVDSDDWVDVAAFQKLLATIKAHVEQGVEADLYVTNFVYERAWDNTRYVRSYEQNLPPERLLTWQEINRFHGSSVLLMHALTYNTDRLRASKTVLPEHTFYVDNIYSYQPLPYMQSIYYLPVDVYRYFIGRADQSVHIDNITRRYRQQILVMKRMTAAYSYAEIAAMPKSQRQYLFHDLDVIMMNTLMFTQAEVSDERLADMRELWQDIKRRDPPMYRRLRYFGYVAWLYGLTARVRSKALVWGYMYYRKKLKLG